MRAKSERAALIGAMVVGSFLMWTAVPAAWLWLAGRYSRVSQSDMTSLVIVLTGIPATMVVIGLGLGRLDGRYTRRFGTVPETRLIGARWLHSLRGGTEYEPITILDKILIVNVVLAVLAVTVFYVFFSEGSQAPRY